MKSLPVRVLARARREILEAHRYLAADRPEAADSLLDDLLEVIASLGEFPALGPVARDPHLAARGFRCVRSGSYRVYYKVVGRTVRVYRVLHERRDAPA